LDFLSTNVVDGLQEDILVRSKNFSTYFSSIRKTLLVCLVIETLRKYRSWPESFIANSESVLAIMDWQRAYEDVERMMSSIHIMI